MFASDERFDRVANKISIKKVVLYQTLLLGVVMLDTYKLMTVLLILCFITALIESHIVKLTPWIAISRFLKKKREFFVILEDNFLCVIETLLRKEKSPNYDIPIS